MAGLPDPTSLSALLGLTNSAVRPAPSRQSPQPGQNVEVNQGRTAPRTMAQELEAISKNQATTASADIGERGGRRLSTAEDNRLNLDDASLDQAKLDPNAPRGTYLNIVV